MKRALVLLHTIALLSLTLIGLSCSGGNSGSPGVNVTGDGERCVLVAAVPSEGTSIVAGQLTGASPLVVNIYMGAGIDPRDYGLSRADILLKLEVDFGDGSGWIDITDDYLRAWDIVDELHPDPAKLTHYTYTSPGFYLISGRATYWDGQVITSNDVGWGVAVHALDPAES